MSVEEQAAEFREVFDKLQNEIGRVIVGSTDTVEAVLTCIFAGGHCLLEGVPGLGKTMLVRTISEALDLNFSRIQFTPDLMPADIIGTNMLIEDDKGHRQMEFRPGPIFANIVLADEINRATPKTQSALLEAMQEHTVSVARTVHTLEEPFFVLATQNPIEMDGTYPLPEAQVDRFMFKLIVDYPPVADEVDILRHYAEGRDPRYLEDYDLNPVLTASHVNAIQRAARSVIIEGKLLQYIVDIVAAARDWGSVTVGPSPRAGINLLVAARTLAACRGRDFVTPDDIKELAPWALRHRLRLRPEAEIEGATPDETIRQIMDSVKAPSS